MHELDSPPFPVFLNALKIRGSVHVSDILWFCFFSFIIILFIIFEVKKSLDYD